MNGWSPWSEQAMDVLQEVGNIGAGHAATALSDLLHEPVRIAVTRARLCAFRDIPTLVGGDEVLTAGVLLRMTGDLSGNMMFLMPVQSARSLVGRLFSREVRVDDGEFDELELSALAEAGNILGCSYINALAELTGLHLVPSVPAVAVDMAAALLSMALLAIGERADAAMVISTSIQQRGADLEGHFFLLPDPASTPALLFALGCRGETDVP
ncbi:MAG: chemotaxis protein CheC [Alicyclobacillus sp.]|nr:chemotaxis protein CheC [Alicyclobacillus sp.]